MRQRHIVLFTLIILLSSCFQLFDDGENKILQTVHNPSKTKEVILFIKDGNATTPTSIQVSIKNGDEKLGKTEGGNTLTLKYSTLLDSSCLKLSWLNDKHLLIIYNKNSQTFIKNNKVNDVTIKYKTQ